MNRDEVLSMAGKCSLLNGLIPVPSQVLRFAELVAGHEREWVGLTKEEAADCWSNEAVRTWHAIEAKLKEKNA